MTDMQLQPFIYFYGRCEEALAHYRDALGGTSTFAAPGLSFAASDGPRARTIDPAEGAFAKLTDGGSVKEPLGPAPWGGTFGIVHDRFGTEWIVTVPPSA